ncbi:MAG TPA: hypothetical protein VK909_19920 [Anaerolineales bacterium]|nr:hypothetical protein [Anaerolineales bacterium]
MKRVYTASKLRDEPRLVIAIAALIAVLFYLLVSAWIFRVGFPLDDTWIHLTYARNLADYGQWAFRLGERSAGSTAPLWTFLLGIGFLLKLAPYIWTFFLGWILLTLLGIHAEKSARALLPAYKAHIPWVGLFFVFAWHLTWSAVSGMETLLHAYIIFIVLTMLLSGSRHYMLLGVLVGTSIWIRPDGITLLGPVLFTAIFLEKSAQSFIEALGKTLIGFGALYGPYMLFNLSLSGNLMPNTFYAKQAEYQAYWLSQPLAARLVSYLWPFLASPFLILLPGAFAWIYKKVRQREWATIASLLWFFGYIAIYFIRMPAYQHGRYIIPAFPILYLFGILGMIEYISAVNANRRIVFFWQVFLGVFCVLFSFIAARQNAFDVYWIESEMVQTAKWVQKNIPPDALLAVHDIGALGYYVPNPIIDMAGLITPQVVPFIRDSSRLAEYLNARSADYLIVFQGQYPGLVAQRTSLFTSGVQPDLLHITDHIQVFSWK